VLPVFNTATYLPDCLDSVLGQDLPAEDVEILAIDDGSTDGSGAILDAAAARHPNLHVVHQRNSGWPGQPRNLGVSRAVGDYVFFLDSDDTMAASLLRESLHLADTHDSDIVVPQISPVGGWRAPVWRSTSVDADLRMAFRTLSPQKLFRRRLLVEHNLQFPEGRVRLEDAIVLSRAYFLARRVSILAGADYYRKRVREVGRNISRQRLDPGPYYESLAVVLRNVTRLCPDPALRDDIVLDLYRQKCLRRLRGPRMVRPVPGRRRAVVRAIGGVAAEFVSPSLQARLRAPERLLSEFARRGDVGAVVSVARARRAGGGVPVRAVGTRLVLDAWPRRDVTGIVAAGERGLLLR